MKKEYVEKLPSWYKNKGQYQTVLSDDIDGLVSTALLRRNCDWTIEYFYDFNALYVSDEYLNKIDKHATRVWADVSFVLKDRDEMTFDNHVNRVHKDDHINKLMINPNLINTDKKSNYIKYNGVTNDNYQEKYGGSTALLIWSLYENELPKTELGKMVLLTIDAAFKGYYSDITSHQLRNLFFIWKMFEFDELNTMKPKESYVLRRHSKEEFYKLIADYHLSRKTRINNEGYLETDLDLNWLSEILELDITLPKKHFNKLIEFNSYKRSVCGILDSVLDVDPVTFAYIGHDICKYSTIKIS